ncbi:uncharacterized protein LOC131605135 [Vicia villosa]|uniref:uncharacterized protein LOC131605135 n=1 Tax=Vicia villosa TaxID=3911 RepID=UPI00273A960F|nr:uncharacterized protein LOC131605135 [Vicia villosa]
MVTRKGRGRGRGRPPRILGPPTLQNPSEQPQIEKEETTEITMPSTDSIEGNRSNNSIEKNINDDERLKTEANPKSSPEEPRKLWVDVISNNCKPANGMNLEFVAPSVVNGEIIVEIEKSDIESEILYWDSALIMYVLGGELSMNMVEQFMIRNWNTVQLLDLLYHDDGYFIMRFKSIKKKEEILMNGPYTIRNMPMLLRDWKPGFNMKNDMLRTIPIWVKLPQLPLELWGAKSLNKIGSAIVTPVVIDECTAQKLRASYARILIEIDATQQVPKEITIHNHEGKKVKQAIEYEWMPKFCGRCQKFRHNCATKRIIPQWKPK